MVHIYKCLLVGDAGVGKTTFIKRHLTGEFQKKYQATLGVAVNPLDFSTSRGEVIFNMWDCAGHFPNMGDNWQDHWSRADAVIIMYDVTSSISKDNIQSWVDKVKTVCGPNIPIVVAGNKTDATKIKSCAYKSNSEQHFKLSAKSNYNFEKPFMWLARKLLTDPNLEFVASLSIMAPEMEIDDELAAALREDHRMVMFEADYDDNDVGFDNEYVAGVDSRFKESTTVASDKSSEKTV